jgi:hypothetical protein
MSLNAAYATTEATARRLPVFSGKQEHWNGWKTVFCASMVDKRFQLLIIETTDKSRKYPEKYKKLRNKLDAAQAKRNEQDEDDIYSDKKEVDVKPSVSANFLRANRIIYGTLLQCLQASCHKLLTDVPFGDGASAWLGLLDEYERPSNMSKRRLLQQLFQLKQERTESIGDYIFRMHRVCKELSDLGVPIATHNDIQLTVLLGGLRASFKTIVTVINADDSIDLKTAETRLKNFQETEDNYQDQKQSADDAFVSRDRDSRDSTEDRCDVCSVKGHSAADCRAACKYCRKTGHKHKDCPLNPTLCFKCNKPGHIARDCTTRAAVAVTPDKTLEDDDWLFLATSSINDSKARAGDFTVDSGATSHFCQDKTIFDTLASSSGSVGLADGKTRLQVQGSGTIGAFKAVKYVPGMGFNLLSVSKLADTGYNVLFRKETCELQDPDSGQVVHSGTREGNLYRINVSDHARAASFKPDDTALLWHNLLETGLESLKLYKHTKKSCLKR